MLALNTEASTVMWNDTALRPCGEGMAVALHIRLSVEQIKFF